jgi:hypothetical protein
MGLIGDPVHFIALSCAVDWISVAEREDKLQEAVYKLKKIVGKYNLNNYSKKVFAMDNRGSILGMGNDRIFSLGF